MVIIDTYSTQAFLYAYLASRLCRLLSISYVPILHGGNLPIRYSKDISRLTKFLNEANEVVSPSLYLQDFFSSKGFSIRFIPNFLEINKYPYLQRPKIQGKLLWVRAFHEIYNPTLAIEVLKFVLTKYPLAELCMVGAAKDHTLRDVQNLIILYGLSEKVKITGVLPKAEWIELSSQYDIFINTTTIDNMPVSVIEAMALGLPIVSTNVGGMPYLIRQGFEGLLTEPGSARAMANGIIDLIENPTRASELASNARMKVEGFDWEVVKQRWFDLIDKITR